MRWPGLGLGLVALGVALHFSGTNDSRRADRPAATARASSPSRVAVGTSVQTAAATVATPGEAVVTARWGGAPGELGKRDANESSPEGPMSFAVDGRGAVHVLDQVNARVAVFEDGRPPRSVELPRDTFQDIELRKDGGFSALDRFGEEKIAYFDAAGNMTHEVLLAGPGVPSGGDVTGLFERDDGTWVEVKHESLVKLTDAEGMPLEERVEAPGRFAADGSTLRMSKSGASAAALVSIDAQGTPRALARVEFPMRVWQLLALETDGRGRIVLAAEIFEESPEAPFDRLAAAEHVVVLEADGRELTRFELPVTDGAEESFRRVRVAPDGTIHHMAFAEDGVTIRRLSR